MTDHLSPSAHISDHTPVYFRWAIAGLLCLLIALPAWKLHLEFENSQHRGRLAGVLVRENMVAAVAATHDVAARQLAADFNEATLRRWLLARLLASVDPGRLATQLETLHPLRPRERSGQATVARWASVLREWGRTPLVGLSNDDLLREGRRRYYEASGYDRIGYIVDASILYLWSALALTEFIRQSPSDEDLPEALFLLGKDIFRLSGSLPPDFRADRIIHLCVELFPESVWADKAHELWVNEVGEHV